MENLNIQPSIRLPRPLGSKGYELKFLNRYTDEEFEAFCAENRDVRVEKDKNGKLIIMPPVDFDGSLYEDEVHGQLYVWRSQTHKGFSFSPTTGFKLPDETTRSADSAWASDEKVAALTPQQRKKFAPIVPDFVIEVRSESDRLVKLKKKMADTWIANGVRLAWLIDPKTKKTYIYRPGESVEVLVGFDRSLSGEGVCPGLELDLRKLL